MILGILSYTALIYDIFLTVGDIQLLSLPYICTLSRVFLLNERILDKRLSATSCLLYVKMQIFLRYKVKHQCKNAQLRKCVHSYIDLEVAFRTTIP